MAKKASANQPALEESSNSDGSAETPEESRLVNYYSLYIENSAAISKVVAAPPAQKPPGAPGSGVPTSNSAKATKTMATRQSLYGDKKTSGAGIQSIKKAGQQRTQSTKK